MKNIGLNEIREKYLAFFEEKQHLRLKSFPLVPHNDKSLLLINSGMAPLKPYFTGQEIPPSKRIATCQKCIRTNDIENVGVTSRHISLFEMLGNFSFGDYFKEEIIPWAWEFLTKEMEIPADRLHVSIYLDDDEAYNIWRNKVGLPHERIVRLGKEDNFWEVGLGPCGPDSEIHFDRGAEYGCSSPDCAVGCGCDRFIEVWNLVFTQFNKEEDGSYSKLANPNIDTGMGLERISCVVQGVNTVFDVDTIRMIRNKVSEIAGKTYGAETKTDTSIKIITDHIRAVTFMTADGVLPSNEGRGYVLRRLLRRAARHGKLLGIEGGFLPGLAETVIEISGGAYPELLEKQDYILKVISVEENKFNETIDAGTDILKAFIQKMKAGGNNILPGTEAFRLYDTYGFPVELMDEILAEAGIGIDISGFSSEMEAQKVRARAARGESNYMGAEETVFGLIDVNISSVYAGHDVLSLSDAVIIALASDNQLAESVEAGREAVVILDRTPFYSESGGQGGDRGIIRTQDGSMEIMECRKVAGNKIAHFGTVTSGCIKRGEAAYAEVDGKARKSTARNHTATHLLQHALRRTLGTHVEQAGSSVDSERLRFDFTHFAAMTRDEIKKTEDIVNEYIFDAMEVAISERTLGEAREMGAMALFGEKYGDTVRVVDIGGVSIELCGGTHLTNTAQIGMFKLLSESGVASGVRRIEALTGSGALAYFKRIEERQERISEMIKAVPDVLIAGVSKLVNQSKELGAELQKMKSRLSANVVDEIMQNKEVIGEVTLVSAQLKDLDMDGLKALGDKIKDRIKNVVIVLASEIGGNDGKVNLVVMASDAAVDSGINAGGIVREAVAVVGGKGGGRSSMAQAGGKDTAKIQEALEKAKDTIMRQLT